MTNISLLVFLLLLQGLHAATVKEKGTGKGVHHFPGQDKDLPKSVLLSKTGKLIKSNGVLLVIRAGRKLSDCQKACQDEFLIKCKYYRYVEVRKSCLLMTSRGLNGTPQATSDKKQEDPKKENGKQKTENDLKNIKKNQKKHEEDMNKIADSLERVRNGKEAALKKIRENEKKMEERLRELLKGEGKMGNVIMELASKLNKISTDVASIKMANDKLKRQLSESGSSSPVIERKLAKLMSEVAELKTRTEMNPTVFKITKNQRILAEALESIDRELTVFQSKLRHIDERTDELRGRQTREELHRKTINDALQILTKAVKNMRTNIKKIINPQSSYNIERTNAMKEVQSQLEMMSRANKKVVYDMSQTRTELSTLLKDLVGIQQAHQQSIASIETLAQANLNTKQNYKVLKSDQDQMMTKIQTLASVYRSVLTALHNLEIKEINVMHKLERYEEAVSRLNANFLGGMKENGKGSKTGKQTSKDLTNFSNLLKSQKYIYSQVMKLRKDLRKVKKQSRRRSKSKAKTQSRKGRRRKKKRKRKGKGMLRLDRKMKGIRELDRRVKKFNEKAKTYKKERHNRKTKEQDESRT